jgi:hypothetical protein
MKTTCKCLFSLLQLEVDRIEREYQLEVELAEKELEERKQELLETLLNETDERKKQVTAGRCNWQRLRYQYIVIDVHNCYCL